MCIPCGQLRGVVLHDLVTLAGPIGLVHLPQSFRRVANPSAPRNTDLVAQPVAWRQVAWQGGWAGRKFRQTENVTKRDFPRPSLCLSPSARSIGHGRS